MADPFEIYFFGLLCFVHDEMGINYAEIVKEHHNRWLYTPAVNGPIEITGRLSTDLSSGATDFGEDIPHLSDHASFGGSSNTVAHKRPGSQAFTVALPRGTIVTADFYPDKKGEFDNHDVRNIPRLVTLLVEDPPDEIKVMQNDNLLFKVKKESWLLIAGVGPQHDCKKKPSHFKMFGNLLEHFDRLDGLCYADANATGRPDKRPKHTDYVLKVIEDLPTPDGERGIVIFNQVDCSSSQWP